jgi:hypothetical protein
MTTMTMLTSDLALQALPEFEATAQRMLTDLAKSKLMVQKALQEVSPVLGDCDPLIDKAHEYWMANAL